MRGWGGNVRLAVVCWAGRGSAGLEAEVSEWNIAWGLGVGGGLPAGIARSGSGRLAGLGCLTGDQQAGRGAALGKAVPNARA